MLIFANTLNTWVLGGLLGGLAALLLSIPISLTLFTLLARRYDARQAAQGFPWGSAFAGDDFSDERVVYEAEGSLVYEDEEQWYEPRSLANGRGSPQSAYRLLPAAGEGLAAYEDEEDWEYDQREPRNYPRRPRTTTHFAGRETQTPSRLEARPRASTRSLAQHRSAALRAARQEAQDQQYGGSGSLSGQPASRARTSRHLRPASSRFEERDTWVSEQEEERSNWRAENTYVDEPETDPVAERYQHYPRHPSYPRQPRASRRRTTRAFDDETEARGSRSRRDSEHLSGGLRASLVRRAPYLYEDDPLREELAQQLEYNRPIVRRSSRYLRNEQD